MTTHIVCPFSGRLAKSWSGPGIEFECKLRINPEELHPKIQEDLKFIVENGYAIRNNLAYALMGGHENVSMMGTAYVRFRGERRTEFRQSYEALATMLDLKVFAMPYRWGFRIDSFAKADEKKRLAYRKQVKKLMVEHLVEERKELLRRYEMLMSSGMITYNLARHA